MLPGMPISPLFDEMFTIEPPPAPRIEGTTACIPSIGPSWFTAITSRYCSGVVFTTLPPRTTPALFTNTVIGPNAASVAATAACQLSRSRTSRCT